MSTFLVHLKKKIRIKFKSIEIILKKYFNFSTYRPSKAGNLSLFNEDSVFVFQN